MEDFGFRPVAEAVRRCLWHTHGLPRNWLAAPIGLAWLAAPVTESATFFVQNFNDSGPGSLREAIIDANIAPGTDIVRFNIDAGAVQLTSGQLEVSDSLSVIGPGRDSVSVDSGDLSRIFLLRRGDLIVRHLTLTGGKAPAGESGGAIGILCHNDTTTPGPTSLTISDSALTGNTASRGGAIGFYNCTVGEPQFRLSLQRNTVSGNTGTTNGAGISVGYLNAVDVDIEILDSEVSDNHGDALHFSNSYTNGSDVTAVITGSRIASNAGDGVRVAGPVVFGSPISTQIFGSRVENNAGCGFDGFGEQILEIDDSVLADNMMGLCADDVDITVRNSDISGNTGTGVDVNGFYYRGYNGSDAHIEGSTVSNNGTGVLVTNGSRAAISSSTISGNTLGLSIVDYYGSGAATLANTTVSGNIDQGIQVQGYDERQSLLLEHSTVSDNGSGQPGGGLRKDSSGCCGVPVPFADLRNSLVAGNHGDAAHPDVFGEVSARYSFFGDIDSAAVVETVPGSNLYNEDPLLGPLTDNGGPTQTHALLAGSPAIDQGDPAFAGPPDFDQRGTGFARVQGGRIDIGAFELQDDAGAAPRPRIEMLADSNGNNAAEILSLGEGTTPGRIAVVVRDAMTGAVLASYEYDGPPPVTYKVTYDLAGIATPALVVLSSNGSAEIRAPLSGDLIGTVVFDDGLDPVDITALDVGGATPALAMLGAGSAEVELRDAATGDRIETLRFQRNLDPRQVFTTDDLDGDGVREIAMLGEHALPDRGDKVQVKTAADELIDNLWLGRRFDVHESVELGDRTGDGVSEIATLRTDVDTVNVAIHDPTTGRQVAHIGFGANYRPVAVLGLADTNGNGAPEVAVVGRNAARDNQRVEIRDSLTKALLLRIWIQKDFIVQDAIRLPDINGNGSDEVAVLGRRSSDGRLVVFVNDGATGERINRIRM